MVCDSAAMSAAASVLRLPRQRPASRGGAPSRTQRSAAAGRRPAARRRAAHGPAGPASPATADDRRPARWSGTPGAASSTNARLDGGADRAGQGEDLRRLVDRDVGAAAGRATAARCCRRSCAIAAGSRSASWPVSCDDSTAPRIATPNEPPSDRKNVADGRAGAQVAHVDRVLHGEDQRLHAQAEADADHHHVDERHPERACPPASRVNSSMPASSTTEPATGNHLYRPIRLIARPVSDRGDDDAGHHRQHQQTDCGSARRP